MIGLRLRALIVLPYACAYGVGAAAEESGSARFLGPPSIEIVGESGKQSETRTIRFQTTGSPTIQFVTRDLVRSSPKGLPRAIIDSGQVRVGPQTPPKTEAKGFAAFEIAVNALPARYGTFSGEIEVQVNGATTERIKLDLAVQYPAGQPIATEPRALSKAMTSVSRWLPGSSTLANRPAVGNFPITIPALPEGIEVTGTNGNVTLMAESGRGPLRGTAALQHTRQDALLVVDASRAEPGKYNGSAELVLADGQRQLLVPVEISVRVNPWLVLLLILIGVGLGRAAKWMNDRGSKILAAQARIYEIEARVLSIQHPFRMWLDPTLADLRAKFMIGQYEVVTTLATTADARIGLVESAGRLDDRATRINNAAIRRRIATLEGDVRGFSDLDAAKTLLRQIETDLRAAEQAAGAADTLPEGDATPSAGLRSWQRTRAVGAWIAPRLQSLLQIVAILLLAFVGFEAIYLNGSPTFGANLVTDYLSAIVWGLSADVAARTVLTLGRTAPRPG